MNCRMVMLGLTVSVAMPVMAGDGGKKGATSVYDFEMNAIDGKSVKLSSYEGDVLMIVNVASK